MRSHRLGKLLVTAALVLFSAAGTVRAGEILYTCPDLHIKEKQTINEMVQGFDGWFFRLKGDLKQDYPLMPEAAAYLRRLSEAFRRRGTHLVFISVPSRGIAAPIFLNPDDPKHVEFDPTYAAQEYGKLIEKLRATGLIVPDLREAAVVNPDDATPFFFKRDHHWTAWGARRTAQVVAEAIKAHPVYQALTRAEYVTTQTGDQQMRHTMALELGHLCSSDIPAESHPKFETHLKPATGADALFGDVSDAEPSILVGSSFTAQEQFNFDGFLSESTGLDIANFALSAGLLFNAIVSLTSAPEFDTMRPPFLFWEAPSIYDLNMDTARFFRQVIPAIYGPCSEQEALATGVLDIRGGEGGMLLRVPEEKRVVGNRYYLFLTTSNQGLAEFTLQFDYADGDGEWFTVDRSEHFTNRGRFFIELSDEIDSPLTHVAVDGLPDIHADLQAHLCRVPE